MVYVGVDLGGTNIAVGLVDENGKILHKDSVPTLLERGPEPIIKDMANLLLPMDAYSLVKRLKETVSIPIHLHTHDTTGNQVAAYLLAPTDGSYELEKLGITYFNQEFPKAKEYLAPDAFGPLADPAGPAEAMCAHAALTAAP